jgi:EmrB/QacA subfamily drug resistance transporter
LFEKIEALRKPEESRNIILFLCLIVGPFLTMLDSSVVNVALPDIATTYNSTLTDVQWVLSGYLLALAAVLVACAFLSKRFGASKVYLVSLLGFTVASAACAFAPSLEWLIVGRALQGAFGASLVPVAMDLLLGGNTTNRRKIPIGFGIILFLAPAIGPTVGGLLINSVGWPSIFLINVPLGIVAGLFLLFNNVMRKHDVIDRNVRFDFIGSVTLAAGLVMTLYGSTEGAENGWLSTGTWPFLVAGVLLILFYLAWARRTPKPAIDLKLLRSFDTGLTLLICVVASIVMFGVLFLVPVVMQSLQGYSAMDTGLAMLPQGIIMGIGVVVGDTVYNKKWLSIRTTVMAGMLLLALSTASLLFFEMSTPAWVSAIILSVRGFAIGLTIQPLLYELMTTLRPEETADGNTLFNVVQRLGGSIGISALATVFQTRTTDYVRQALSRYHVDAGSVHVGQSSTTLSTLPVAMRDAVGMAAINGFHETVWILVGLSLLGLVLAFFLKPAKKIVEVPAIPQTAE